MKTIRRGLSLTTCIGTALWLAAAPGCGEEGTAFENEASEIHNGTTVTSTTNAMVAVFHRSDDGIDEAWDPRPCSGIVLNPSGLTDAYILTARHCLTPAWSNPFVDGPIISPEFIKVTGAYAPGLTPPSDALAACKVSAPPVGTGYLGLNETLDMAIVHTCDLIPHLPTAVTVSKPLFLASSAELEDATLDMYGYGCSGGSGSTCTGAGVLRESEGHPVTDFVHTSPGATGYDWNMYTYGNNSNGAWLDHGDSGGPAFASLQGSRWMQVGVRTNAGSPSQDGEDTVVSRITMQWIQSVIKRIYIRPHGAMSEALTRSGTGSGASLSTVSSLTVRGGGSTALRDKQWFRYDFDTRRFFLPSSTGAPVTCLRRNGTTADMATCSSSSSQKWWVNGDSTVRDSSGTQCLQRQSNGSVVVSSSCSSSNTSQKWYFDGDSHAPGSN